MKTNSKKVIILMLILTGVLMSGCVSDNEITGYTVDVGFKDGSYTQYNHIIGTTVVYEGVFSHTIDLETSYGNTIRLHYVTSVDKV